MKRTAALLQNLILVIVSAGLAAGAAHLLDRSAGEVLRQRLWPGPMGLLFQPHTEDHWKTRDYACDEYINSLGFRDHEIPKEKTRAFRIVAIGDSFTYGWGVNLEDTWCKRLEHNLRENGLDVAVLNLGKPAAGPNEYAAIAESAIPVLRPNLVLIGCLAGDDLQQAGMEVTWKDRIASRYPNLVHLARYWKNRRVYATQSLITKRSPEECRQIWIDVAKGLLKSMPAEHRARFDRLEESIRADFHDGLINPWMINHAAESPGYFLNTVRIEDLEDRIAPMARAFRRIGNAARRYGARAIVLSIPEGFYVNKEAYRNIQRVGFQTDPGMLATNAPDEAVRRACERAGLDFLCVTGGFRAHSEEPGLYFELDRHFTPAGNALYADLITPSLAKDIGHAVRDR